METRDRSRGVARAGSLARRMSGNAESTGISWPAFVSQAGGVGLYREVTALDWWDISQQSNTCTICKNDMVVALFEIAISAKERVQRDAASHSPPFSTECPGGPGVDHFVFCAGSRAAWPRCIGAGDAVAPVD